MDLEIRSWNILVQPCRVIKRRFGGLRQFSTRARQIRWTGR